MRHVSTIPNQRPIRCLLMRGGTSRGPFFDARDLPADPTERDCVLLSVMGSPDPLQVDGLGGGHPLTSKAGIVAPGTDGIDVEWTFAQLQPDSDLVDTTPNCGNMLAAVLPFAIETGILKATDDTTTARVLTLNTGAVAEITVETPVGPDGERFVRYDGEARIDGVPGTAAPVRIGLLDTAGSVAGSLLPTGNVRDTVEVPGLGSIDVTLIDNGQPLVVVAAGDLGASGEESPEEIDADHALRARIEALRIVTGHAMGLGDVTEKPYPKMTLVSTPRHGGAIGTRSLIPHRTHRSIGVLAAVTAATAAVLPGSVAYDLAVAAPVTTTPDGVETTLGVEHPTGEFSVTLGLEPGAPVRVTRSALLRTARLIMAGQAMVPSSISPTEEPA